ncbi:hypothetical protein [Amycolatopsis sp. CA-128772]|uniref:DUF7665 family protein n=1 Tax=Amycolatopsis sp. CA-128772 TaxID=2073159 RepID=UPI0011B0D4A2|nr:hypothetical protein [Amycolatopsis sp. CA-128772]
MPGAGASPNELRLTRDLASNRFESGVAAGSWRVVAFDWPHLTVAITAGDGNELSMRLLVDGYPGQAPAGQPWDLATDSPLPASRWPTGGMTSMVFRTDWSPANGNAPYLACDRVALATHAWATQHPERAWNSSRSIEFYLEQVYHELAAATIPQT